jgi:hypothetical protein
MDTLLPYVSKESRAQSDTTPKEQRQPMFKKMKELGTMTNVKVVKETKTPNGYVLELTAVGPKKTRNRDRGDRDRRRRDETEKGELEPVGIGPARDRDALFLVDACRSIRGSHRGPIPIRPHENAGIMRTERIRFHRC